MGKPPREYQSCVRHLEALRLLPGQKVEAVALQVGYKSKTNFYRVFRRLTGLTPSEFLRLPQSRQSGIVGVADRAMELSLVSAIGAVAPTKADKN